MLNKRTRKIIPEDKIPMEKSTTIRSSDSSRDPLGSTVAIMDSIDNNESEFHDKRRKNEMKIQKKINFLEQQITKLDKQKRYAQESLKNMKRLLEKSQAGHTVGPSFVCTIQ